MIIIIIIIITILLIIIIIFREGTFSIGGGGGPVIRRGGSLVNFFNIREGQTCFILSRGGHTFFGKEKITPCCFYFVYTSKATGQD